MNKPISREAVFETVEKQVLGTIYGVSEEAIARVRSLGDLGATSLDVVEIVSGAMRDLKINAPRSELLLAETLDELVDVLHRCAVEQARISAS